MKINCFIVSSENHWNCWESHNKSGVLKWSWPRDWVRFIWTKSIHKYIFNCYCLAHQCEIKYHWDLQLINIETCTYDIWSRKYSCTLVSSTTTRTTNIICFNFAVFASSIITRVVSIISLFYIRNSISNFISSVWISKAFLIWIVDSFKSELNFSSVWSSIIVCCIWIVTIL